MVTLSDFDNLINNIPIILQDAEKQTYIDRLELSMEYLAILDDVEVE